MIPSRGFLERFRRIFRERIEGRYFERRAYESARNEKAVREGEIRKKKGDDRSVL
jgi:hypothetical protein